MSSAFDVHCPVCHAALTISPEARAVVGHREPKSPKPAADMDTAVQALKQDPQRRAGLFKEAIESEKSKADRLKKSFNDLLHRAKEEPDSVRPLRDMDLD
jgi:hypothetical protein